MTELWTFVYFYDICELMRALGSVKYAFYTSGQVYVYTL